MPDKITINEQLQLASVVPYGKVTSDEIENSINELARLFKEEKIDKVLVDTTKIEALPNAARLYSLSKKFPAVLKFALVASRDQLIFEELQFIETTSINKGKMVKVFESAEKAGDWLAD
ncbi:MAG: hypothetical protein L3J31_00920 [Bacteroidales bacterium]|nr:hypothetical protein [Bacteroidales bacterium]MCF6341353.1 hypothetical protein [Bacteroidales bacterium]